MSSASETESPRDDETSVTADDSSSSVASTNDSRSLAEAGDDSQLAASLGVERWVIFAFLIGAFVTYWLSKNLIIAIWDRFDEPRPIVATAAAVILALLGAFLTYQRPNVHAFATDVATEYAKVTWPTREEAWNHTVVVILVSFVATLILAVFDLGWSSLTNLLYQ